MPRGVRIRPSWSDKFRFRRSPSSSCRVFDFSTSCRATCARRIRCVYTLASSSYITDLNHRFLLHCNACLYPVARVLLTDNAFAQPNLLLFSSWPTNPLSDYIRPLIFTSLGSWDSAETTQRHSPARPQTITSALSNFGSNAPLTRCITSTTNYFIFRSSCLPVHPWPCLL
jgi:hypothetical protein